MRKEGGNRRRNEKGSSESGEMDITDTLKPAQANVDQPRIEEMKCREKKRHMDAVREHENEGEWMSKVQDCPVYTPTFEELKDPIAYIRSIGEEASKFGICKIVPPTPALVPGPMAVTLFAKSDGKSGAKKTVTKFATRLQKHSKKKMELDQPGMFYESKKKYTLQEFQKIADDFAAKRYGSASQLPPRYVEGEYWRLRSSPNGVTVHYANDVEGTAFPYNSEDKLSQSGWNLRDLPRLDNSLLRLLRSDIPGVSEPMLYLGMMFSTFAWHVEDHFLYSINYNHMGAPKTWYGVPSTDAEEFERIVHREVFKLKEEEVHPRVIQALIGKTTMFSPKHLVEGGVKVVRAVQGPGEFIVTFPRAYHGGFNNGFNCAEAVNFCTTDWFQHGIEAAARHRYIRRPSFIPLEEMACREFFSKGEADESVTAAFVSIFSRVHLLKNTLAKRGICMEVYDMPEDIDSSCQCSKCGDICFLAQVVPNERATSADKPTCLDCFLALEQSVESNGNPPAPCFSSHGTRGVILRRNKFVITGDACRETIRLRLGRVVDNAEKEESERGEQPVTTDDGGRSNQPEGTPSLPVSSLRELEAQKKVEMSISFSDCIELAKRFNAEKGNEIIDWDNGTLEPVSIVPDVMPFDILEDKENPERQLKRSKKEKYEENMLSVGDECAFCLQTIAKVCGGRFCSKRCHRTYSGINPVDAVNAGTAKNIDQWLKERSSNRPLPDWVLQEFPEKVRLLANSPKRTIGKAVVSISKKAQKKRSKLSSKLKKSIIATTAVTKRRSATPIEEEKRVVALEGLETEFTAIPRRMRVKTDGNEVKYGFSISSIISLYFLDPCQGTEAWKFVELWLLSMKHVDQAVPNSGLPPVNSVYGTSFGDGVVDHILLEEHLLTLARFASEIHGDDKKIPSVFPPPPGFSGGLSMYIEGPASDKDKKISVLFSHIMNKLAQTLEQANTAVASQKAKAFARLRELYSDQQQQVPTIPPAFPSVLVEASSPVLPPQLARPLTFPPLFPPPYICNAAPPINYNGILRPMARRLNEQPLEEPLVAPPVPMDFACPSSTPCAQEVKSDARMFPY